MATTRRRRTTLPTPEPEQVNTFDFDAPPPGVALQAPEPLTYGDEVVTGAFGGQRERVGLLDGDETSPLDPDLAALAQAGDERQRALALKYTQPDAGGAAHRVPLVYVGTKDGTFMEAPPIIALNVPRDTDREAVKRLHNRHLVDMHPGSSRYGQPLLRDDEGNILDQRELSQGRRVAITHENLHLTGETITFVLNGPSVLVDEADAPFFLDHQIVKIERGDTPERVAAASRATQELAIAAHLWRLAHDAQAREQAEQLAKARQGELARLRSTTERNTREGRTYGGATRPEARP